MGTMKNPLFLRLTRRWLRYALLATLCELAVASAAPLGPASDVAVRTERLAGSASAGESSRAASITRATAHGGLAPSDATTVALGPSADLPDVVRVAIDVTDPPYGLSDPDGTPVGIAVNFARAALARLPPTAHWVPYRSTSELRRLIAQKRIDVIAVQNPDVPLRADLIAGPVYMVSPMVVVGRTAASTVDDASGAGQRRIGYDEKAIRCATIVESFPGQPCEPVDDTEAGLQALEEGRIDAYVGDYISVESAIRRAHAGRVRVLARMGVDRRIAMALVPDAAALAAPLREALESISPQQRAALQNFWLVNSPYDDFGTRAFRFKLGLVAGGLCLVAVMVGAAYWRLTREVRRRERTEAVLARQLAFNHALLATVPYPLVAKGNDNRITAVNPAYERFVGREAEELLGRTTIEAHAFNVHFDRMFDDLSRRCIENRREVRSEHTITMRDGRSLSVLYAITPFGEATGEYGGALVTMVDVTRIREAEERAIRSERRLTEITDNIPAVVFKLHRSSDGELSFRYVAGDSQAMFGMTLSEMTQNERAVLRRVHPEDRDMIERAVKDAAAGHHGFEVEFRVPGAQGERWVLGRALPSAARDGETEWDGYWIDTTENHRQAEALIAARRAAEAVTEARSRFLAMMSHELRTPLSAVVNLLELVLATPLDAQQRMLLTRAATASETLMRILGEVLDLSRIDSGRMALDPHPVDLMAVAEEVCRMLASSITARGVRLRLRISPDLAALLQADDLRIKQLLLNLLGNASKFTESGHIIVWLQAKAHAIASQRVTLAVEDTGIGMNEAQMRRALEPFEQVHDQSSNVNHGGTGLGLTICQRLAELMGGSLQLRSVPGKGTTVSVSLPLAVVRRDREAPAGLAGRCACIILNDPASRDELTAQLALLGMHCLEYGETERYDLAFIDEEQPCPEALKRVAQIRITERALVSGHEHTADGVLLSVNPLTPSALRAASLAALSGDLSDVASAATGQYGAAARASIPAPSFDAPIRVLIADDQEVHRIALSHQLQRLGCAFETVDNGQAALNALARGAFSLLLTDVQMPECDGLALTRRWREQEAKQADGHGAAPHMPVIGITADAVSNVREACREAGMDEVLLKPIRLSEMRALLQRYLGRGRRSAAPGAPAAHADESADEATAPGVPRSDGMETGEGGVTVDEDAAQREAHLFRLRQMYGDGATRQLLQTAQADIERDLAVLEAPRDMATLRATLHNIIGLAAAIQAVRLNEAGVAAHRRAVQAERAEKQEIDVTDVIKVLRMLSARLPRMLAVLDAS